jgi:predicted  nucleic acid-binding Zn-ribbon protein
MAEINSERSEKQRQVDEMRSGLDSELLKLYDKIKSDHAGVGAAQLNGKTCNGCRIEISATDLATINSALDDELIRCDECRRILVR